MEFFGTPVFSRAVNFREYSGIKIEGTFLHAPSKKTLCIRQGGVSNVC